MPVLFFPNLNALRLALASGLVPDRFARAPASAGFDSHDRPWLELAELPPREHLTALARLGVQALGGTTVPLSPVGCWAELLPLRPAGDPPAGTILFAVPDRQLAAFLARLRRHSRSPTGVQLRDAAPLAWVTVVNPPAAILREAAETGSAVEAFAEQVSGVWVRCGWEHPVAALLVVPQECVLVLRPPRHVVAAAETVPVPRAEEFALRPGNGPCVSQALQPSIPIRLTLGRRQSPGRETLWVLDAAGEAEFWVFCAAADERVLRRLEAAAVWAGDQRRVVIRGSAADRPPPYLPLHGTGYAPDPRVSGLWVPGDRALRPFLRVRELGRVLGLAPDRVVWVEPTAGGGVVPHAVASSAFRPVIELIEYTPPAAGALRAWTPADPFTLARFAVQDDPVPPIDLGAPSPSVGEGEPATQSERTEERPGWLGRSLHRLIDRLRRPREPRSQPAAGKGPSPTPAPGSRRVERKLVSADALLHGQDWAARKRELEARLFRDLPRLGPEGRAGHWAELAGVYAATANPADAAICWLNAVWESPHPPAEWLREWLAAECRTAKLAVDPGAPERWLGEPTRPGPGRLIAAYSAWAGFAPHPPAEYIAALPRILTLLEQQFDDLPVRAAWLARLAATRACDGDALGLARWRDRVLARLGGRGPGLDLDEPSFLRFHGTASAERFQTARAWLVKIRKPVLDWVQEQGGGGRFQREGLDAETECTAAYAQLMLAWGLASLGERTQAKDWAVKARQALARAPRRPWVDPAVHATLCDLFLHRVKDAQEGRPPKPGLPPDLRARVDRFPPGSIERYSVEKLCEQSRIVEPIERVRAEGGLSLKTFWGSDRLGERLSVLAEQPERAHVAAEADALLRVCDANPATDTVPRIVLTLLEVAARLAPAALVRLLDLLPTAFEWMEAWVAAGPWSDAERPDALTRYRVRILETAFAAAPLLHGSGLEPAVGRMTRQLLSVGDSVRQPLLAVARGAFRAIRRLGLRGEAESLVRFLDPDPAGPADRAAFRPDRLGVAAGWFVAGDEEAGHRILDAARNALGESTGTDLRSRTQLATAYAEALGFAPPGLALGRLEELFQKDGHGNTRLGRVACMGSTNSYYTLQPLQLIDAVVRSVVTDEFALSPAVRGWLDDDEFLIRGRIHRDMAAVLREQNLV